MQLSKQTKLSLVAAGATSAGTAVNSSVVDMANFEGVQFFGRIATANAGNFAKLQHGDLADGTDMADLEGTKRITGDNGDSFSLDLYKPRKRYVRCVIVRGGADTVTGDVYAMQYCPRVMPTTQGSTIDAESHVSPATGTA